MSWSQRPWRGDAPFSCRSSSAMGLGGGGLGGEGAISLEDEFADLYGLLCVGL